ncbi:MAG: RHS repeat protein, partial [Chloroflexi bacterium]|nr:RHS repeat protein [Chloroflexota bacterium]
RKETQYPQGGWPAAPNGAAGGQLLVTQTTYDPNSNRATLVDPLGQTTSFGHDALNRLIGISYSDGTTPNVSYAYDADGNRSSMQDGTGQTTYSYDELDRLLSVTSPGSQTVGYRYDLDGNRRQLIYPDGSSVAYAYDQASRMQTMTDWSKRLTSYAYTPDGLL